MGRWIISSGAHCLQRSGVYCFDTNNSVGLRFTGTLTGVVMQHNRWVGTHAGGEIAGSPTTYTRRYANIGFTPGIAGLGAAFILPHDGADFVRVSANGDVASVTSSGSTAITAGTFVGQMLTVLNTDTDVGANEIIIQQNATTLLNGSANLTLGKRDTATFMWDGTNWVQVGSTGNN